MNFQMNYLKNFGLCPKFGNATFKSTCFYYCIVDEKKEQSKKIKKEDMSSNSSTISSVSIQQVVENLKFHRFMGTTKRNYYSVWKNFNEFFIRLDNKPEEWEDRIVLFVGYLIHYKGSNSQTIRSYISAIKATLLNEGIKLNENRFLLNSLTCACKQQNDKYQMRMPIQKPLLMEMLRIIDRLFTDQSYLMVLYKTLFVTMYFGPSGLAKLH